MGISNQKLRKFLELKRQAKEIDGQLKALRKEIQDEGGAETRDYIAEIVEQQKTTIRDAVKLIEKIGRTPLRGFINEYTQYNVIVKEKKDVA